MVASEMTVNIQPTDKRNSPGKLADVELHFVDGPLQGLKLIGFAIWERGGAGRNVTFPGRQYSVNGEPTELRITSASRRCDGSECGARSDPRSVRGI